VGDDVTGILLRGEVNYYGGHIILATQLEHNHEAEETEGNVFNYLSVYEKICRK